VGSVNDWPVSVLSLMYKGHNSENSCLQNCPLPKNGAAKCVVSPSRPTQRSHTTIILHYNGTDRVWRGLTVVWRVRWSVLSAPPRRSPSNSTNMRRSSYSRTHTWSRVSLLSLPDIAQSTHVQPTPLQQWRQFTIAKKYSMRSLRSLRSLTHIFVCFNDLGSDSPVLQLRQRLA